MGSALVKLVHPLHRWTHLAAVAEGHRLRLYINGLLDSENATVGSIVHNNGPFFLGGDLWRPAGGFDGFVDEFKSYGRALTTTRSSAAGFALGGVEPSLSSSAAWDVGWRRDGHVLGVAPSVQRA